MKAKVLNNNVQKVFSITHNHDDVNANWVNWKIHAPHNHASMVVNASQLIPHTNANVHQVSMVISVN
jgi:hypothetical protein